MLTPEKIRELWENYSPTKGIESFARSVEAEVRKDYDALIRQMLEALDATHGWWGNGEWYGSKTPHWHELTSVARAAARARLEKAPWPNTLI